MFQRTRILGPKVYDPTLAKKILGSEDEHSECEKDSEETLPDESIADVTKEEDGETIKNAEDFDFFQHMKDVLVQLTCERQRRGVCLSKISEVETELMQFTKVFAQQLQELRELARREDSQTSIEQCE